MITLLLWVFTLLPTNWPDIPEDIRVKIIATKVAEHMMKEHCDKAEFRVEDEVLYISCKEWSL